MIQKLFQSLIDALVPIFQHWNDGLTAFYSSFAVVESTIQDIYALFPLLPAFIVTLVSIGIFICVANIVLKVI